MAVRRWQVRPDIEVPTAEYGLVLAVSRPAIDQAFLDGAVLVAQAGGVFTVIAGRHPTDLPGEMMTTGLVCEWKDRTDAKPQPEPQVDVLPAVDTPREIELEEEDEPVVDVVAEGNGSPDGLDYAALADEDLAEVPEGP